MPSYTHNFIYSVVYSNNDNNATPEKYSNRKEHRSSGTGNETEGSQGTGTQGTPYKESAGNTCKHREGLLRTWRFVGQNIRQGKRYILQGQRCKTGIEARLIEVCFKYPNLFYYLMLIDTAFTDITLVINLTNIQNLLKTIGVY